jgi:hypothetical protein
VKDTRSAFEKQIDELQNQQETRDRNKAGYGLRLRQKPKQRRPA